MEPTPTTTPMTDERWSELDIHYSPAVSVDHASAAIVECLTEIARQENEIARLVTETHNWSASVKKLEAERAAPQWKEVKAGLTTPRCLPEIDEKVLLLRASGNIAVGQLTWAYRWLLKDNTILLLQSISHWMPLPAAPVTVEGSQPHV